jgi:hypothetical protein
MGCFCAKHAYAVIECVTRDPREAAVLEPRHAEQLHRRIASYLAIKDSDRQQSAERLYDTVYDDIVATLVGAADCAIWEEEVDGVNLHGLFRLIDAKFTIAEPCLHFARLSTICTQSYQHWQRCHALDTERVRLLVTCSPFTATALVVNQYPPVQVKNIVRDFLSSTTPFYVCVRN